MKNPVKVTLFQDGENIGSKEIERDFSINPVFYLNECLKKFDCKTVDHNKITVLARRFHYELRWTDGVDNDAKYDMKAEVTF